MNAGRLRRLCGLLGIWLVGMLLAQGCALPTPTPAPSPTPWPTPTAQQPETTLSAYLAAVEPYGSLYAVVRARHLSVVETDLILFRLRQMKPPADLQETHVLLITAYEYIREGRKILAQEPIRELRAEGEFQVDWGIRYIMTFQEEIVAYMETRAPEGDWDP